MKVIHKESYKASVIMSGLPCLLPLPRVEKVRPEEWRMCLIRCFLPLGRVETEGPGEWRISLKFQG